MSLFEQFYAYEAAFRDLTIDGIDCWHLFRGIFYKAFATEDGINKIDGPDSDLRYKTKAEMLRVGLGFLMNAVLKNPYSALPPRAYLASAAPRFVVRDGRTICYLFEPLFTLRVGKVSYIERPVGFRHNRAFRMDGRAYTDRFELMRYVNERRKRYQFSEADKRKLTRMIDQFAAEFGVSADNARILEKLQHNWNGYRTYHAAFGKLMDRLRPKYIAEEEHYSQAHFALTKCAHERGLPVIELQHGIIGRGHFAYNYPVRDAYTPDYLLSYGEAWTANIAFTGCILPVGYPYLEESVRENRPDDATKEVLFLSQPTVSEALLALALALVKNEAFRRAGYKVLYKLHPSECRTWRRLHGEIDDPCFELVDSPEKTLYQCFGEAVAQVGVHSTALFEGLAFGLKTYLLDVPGIEYMQGLLDMRDVCVIQNCEDIVSTLHGKETVRVNVEKYWKSNSMENFEKALERIEAETEERE